MFWHQSQEFSAFVDTDRNVLLPVLLTPHLSSLHNGLWASSRRIVTELVEIFPSEKAFVLNLKTLWISASCTHLYEGRSLANHKLIAKLSAKVCAYQLRYSKSQDLRCLLSQMNAIFYLIAISIMWRGLCQERYRYWQRNLWPSEWLFALFWCIFWLYITIYALANA
jgi:hypothetical protein